MTKTPSLRCCLAIVPVALTMVTAVPAQQFPVSSTFDNNNEGWSIFNQGSASWSATGGNPGGYVNYIFAGNAPTAISAPSEFLGDWSTLGDTDFITYDHFIGVQDDVNGTFNHQISLSGPGGTAFWGGPPPAAPNSGWAKYTVSLDAQEWTTTSGTWQALLDNVDEFVIRYELYGNATGTDQEGIDNVFVVPEPSAATMLFFGLILARRRRGRIDAAG